MLGILSLDTAFPRVRGDVGCGETFDFPVKYATVDGADPEEIVHRAGDAVMWNAWAVLNLHKTEDNAVFEPIRCFYPLTNRVAVISEDVQGDAAADAFRDAMFFFPRGEIASAVRALRDDADGFRAATANQFDSFERKSAVAHFHAALDRYFEELTPRERGGT